MTGLSDELNKLNTEGWSNRDIERIAERHGHKLHNSTVSNYLAGRHSKPTARVLAAFADVFGVDVNTLRAAAGLHGVGEPLDLGPESGRLTGPQREAVRHVVRVMLEQNDALADQSQPDGATIRLSDRRPRLLGGEDPSILEMPFAADTDDPDDDPGEDHH